MTTAPAIDLRRLRCLQMTSEQMQLRAVIVTWPAFPALSPPRVRVPFVFFAYPRTRLVPRPLDVYDVTQQ